MQRMMRLPQPQHRSSPSLLTHSAAQHPHILATTRRPRHCWSGDAASPWPPTVRRGGALVVRASSNDDPGATPAAAAAGAASSSNPSSSSGSDRKIKVEAPKAVTGLFKSLQDFGIGKTGLKEGGIGLFILFGAAAALALVSWARGNAMRVGTPYNITIELPLACGVTIGTPVRIRGVQVGQVLNVKPSLERVDILCEMNDLGSVIPRNSVIESNQSGLIAEPLLDITPQLPLPTWKHAPNHAECKAEGAIVCENGRITGQPGVALDDLVYIMTRLARQVEEEGLGKVFAAAEEATQLMKEAQPLLKQSLDLVHEVTPLITQLSQSGLVNNLEALTSTAAAAAADIQSLQGAVLTEENVKALRQSVVTLCRTLEHVESISSDVSVFTRDSSVQRNLKTLVQALSRIVDE